MAGGTHRSYQTRRYSAAEALWRHTGKQKMAFRRETVIAAILATHDSELIAIYNAVVAGIAYYCGEALRNDDFTINFGASLSVEDSPISITVSMPGRPSSYGFTMERLKPQRDCMRWSQSNYDLVPHQVIADMPHLDRVLQGLINPEAVQPKARTETPDVTHTSELDQDEGKERRAIEL